MNEDRIEGAGRELLGKGERVAGSAIGSERLEGDGIADQISGAVQQGYGQAKDAIERAIDDAPAVLGHAAERGRELKGRGDQVIRELLGENGPRLVTIGACALLALGAVALVRSSAAATPKTKPKSSRRKPTPARRG